MSSQTLEEKWKARAGEDHGAILGYGCYCGGDPTDVSTEKANDGATPSHGATIPDETRPATSPGNKPDGEGPEHDQDEDARSKEKALWDTMTILL